MENKEAQVEDKSTDVSEETKVSKEAEEKTIGDMIDSKEERVVPEAKFIEQKKELKTLKKQLKEMEDGKNKVSSSDIEKLADEHDVDSSFVRKLAESIKAETRKELEEEIASKLKPYEEKDRLQKVNDAFEKEYSKLMENNPEYSNIVNKDVVKNLMFVPGNAKKTLNQLIQESYGHLVKGKKTLDSGNSVREKDTSVDFNKAQKDPEYLQSIMKDPTRAKQYKEEMIKYLASM